MRDVFYITVTLTERTQLHVSAHNDLLSTRLHDAHGKRKKIYKKGKDQVFSNWYNILQSMPKQEK